MERVLRKKITVDPWHALAIAGVLTGLALRSYLVLITKTPGHGDSAFYYTVAKNITEGHGPVIDYIVYFFSGLLPLPHYAGDFWNPSASYLIAIPMLLFGTSISSALIAPILAGLLPAAAGFLAGRKFSGSTAVGTLTGILTFFSPFQVWFSVTTEAIIFSGAFGAMAIYLMMKSDESPRYFLFAAIFTGLTNLIRQDGILLLATLEIWILLAALAWREKIKLASLALVIHLLVLTPLLIKNYTELGVIFPPGPGKTAFLTTYEDFHSYGKELDWRTLRATWGIRGIIQKKLHTAHENLGQVEYFVDPVLEVLFLFTLAELIFMRQKQRRLLLLIPASLFALFEYLFYSFIASFSGPGSLIKSLGALMPFICLVIVDSIIANLKPKVLYIGIILLLAAYSGYRGFEKNYNSTIYYNGVYEQYKTLANIVNTDARTRGIKPNDIALLARNTWDVNAGTGFKTVMVPNNDIATIVAVAAHYNAHYLLLPAKRPQLDAVYNRQAHDPRFEYIASIPGSDMRLFWVKFVP